MSKDESMIALKLKEQFNLNVTDCVWADDFMYSFSLEGSDDVKVDRETLLVYIESKILGTLAI